MPIDFYATEVAYCSHLAPLWFALPVSERGIVFVRHTLAEYVAREGITNAKNEPLPRSDRLTVVASYQDSVEARRCGRSVVLVEHGAGQRYVGSEQVENHPSYHGSSGHDGTSLFVCPRKSVAAAWQARYPTAATVVAGCPKLDNWHRSGRPVPSGPTTVAVSFHSDLALCPETRSALPHYERGLADVASRLRAEGITLVGHSHPRLWRRAKVVYERAGIEAIEDFGEVLARASGYVCDNSSTLYEAASVGIPVVALNAPWFRRDVVHGLRFWSDIPGHQCDEPEQLADSILRALSDPESAREERERVVARVYIATDGRASERAVAAILTAAAGLP